MFFPSHFILDFYHGWRNKCSGGTWKHVLKNGVFYIWVRKETFIRLYAKKARIESTKNLPINFLNFL